MRIRWGFLQSLHEAIEFIFDRTRAQVASSCSERQRACAYLSCMVVTSQVRVQQPGKSRRKNAGGAKDSSLVQRRGLCSRFININAPIPVVFGGASLPRRSARQFASLAFSAAPLVLGVRVAGQWRARIGVQRCSSSVLPGGLHESSLLFPSDAPRRGCRRSRQRRGEESVSTRAQHRAVTPVWTATVQLARPHAAESRVHCFGAGSVGDVCDSGESRAEQRMDRRHERSGTSSETRQQQQTQNEPRKAPASTDPSFVSCPRLPVVVVVVVVVCGR